ncbi:MAG: alpha/beta hydrolase [Ignavibacteria bacterium]|nr:alpha/beta hydrolase [Ignavibacteria bacterium]
MNPHARVLICIVSIVFLIAGCAKEEAKSVKEEDANIEKSTGVVSVEGAELHYVVEGKGTPCIGLGHSESQRRILSQELRNHFRLVSMDLRHDAQSNSSLEISKITLDTYLDDIDKVRRTLGLDKIAVFGHSIHSYIALEYARRYPKNTSYVVMTGCMPYKAGTADEFWESDASAERKVILKQNWEKITEDELSRMPSRERVVKTYMAMAPKLFYDPTYDLSWIYEAVESNEDIARHLFNVIFKDYDIAKRPGRVETPVFLAIGRYDYFCPYFLWDDKKDALPNLSYNLFEKSGHFPMVEERELFDKKLIEWISSH